MRFHIPVLIMDKLKCLSDNRTYNLCRLAILFLVVSKHLQIEDFTLLKCQKEKQVLEPLFTTCQAHPALAWGQRCLRKQCLTQHDLHTKSQGWVQMVTGLSALPSLPLGLPRWYPYSTNHLLRFKKRLSEHLTVKYRTTVNITLKCRDSLNEQSFL